MKIQDYDHHKLEFLLEKISLACDISRDVYFATETKDKEGLCLFRYETVADLIYREMLGVSVKDVTSYFGTPGGETVAWYYDAKKGNKKTGCLPGPETKDGRVIICYIPDCILDVIISPKMDKHEKHELLKKMMGDLAKLHEAYEYKKKLFAETI